MEQGRGLRPSPEVLDALARALRLSDDEHAYLFDLAQQRPVRQRRVTSGVGLITRLVHDLSPLPAILLNHRFDILAWNPEMAGLMLDFDTLPDEQRNALWLCLLHPAFRDFYCDRERVVREGIADLRAAWAARPDDAALGELVGQLTSGSEEFARLWALRDVLGPLTVVFEVLIPLQDPDHRLVIYRAADAASQVALDTITREVTCVPALHAL